MRLIRVTRLGKFSPNGQVFTLGRFLKMTEIAPSFGATFFPKYRLCIDFDKKIVGLHFGRIFSRTYPVTLCRLFTDSSQFPLLFMEDNAAAELALVSSMAELGS
jgi:hypothetical protein